MTTLTKYQPLLPFSSLRNEVDRLFGDAFPTMFESDNGDLLSTVWAPRMDLSETDNEFLLKMDLPGVKKDQITVNIEDNKLTISGERKEETREENENYLRVERAAGSFYRAIPLPKTANIKKIEAKFAEGVLKVRVPKAQESKPQKVSIL